MQDQLALLPTQMAMRCISQGLRGGLPIVLGLSALTIGGTIYGAVQGSKALKTYCEKPKPGKNKGWKIQKEVGKQKEGQIFAFEMKEEFYKKFEKRAKELGVAFAVTQDKETGICHVITDNKNKSIVDMLQNISQEVKENQKPLEFAQARRENSEPLEFSGDNDFAPYAPPIPQDNEVGLSQKDKNLEENFYTEVDFKDSLWAKIMDFVKEKIINPLKGGDVNVEENDNIAYINYNNRKDKHMLMNRIDDINYDIQRELGKDVLSKDNIIEFKSYLDKNDAIAEVAQKSPRKASKIEPPKFPKFIVPNISSNIEGEFNQFVEKTLNKTRETPVPKQHISMDIEKMPELQEMMKNLLYEYAQIAQKNAENNGLEKDSNDIISEAVEKTNEGLKTAGFKGAIELETSQGKEPELKINFDTREKNNIIQFARTQEQKNQLGKDKGLTPQQLLEETLVPNETVEMFTNRLEKEMGDMENEFSWGAYGPTISKEEMAQKQAKEPVGATKGSNILPPPSR